MSTRIIDISYLNRIGKFLSLNMSDGKAKEKVIRFHRLNCVSYYKSIGSENKRAKYSIEDLDFSDVPLISSVQAVSDLEAVLSNCLESGEDLNIQVFEEMRIRIQQFKEHYDYDVMKQYKDHLMF